MKWLFTTILCSFFVQVSIGQEPPFPSNSEQIVKESKHISFWRFKDPKQVAEILTEHLNTEEEKALAIANWICNNIKYDYRSFKKYRLATRTDAKILRKGKALCGGYASLYKSMCDEVGIACEIVSGYIKNRYYVNQDSMYWSQHAWNTVRLGGNWYLVDLTWGSGHLANKKQRIRRYLWRKIRLPFRLKFKWKKDVNFKWLYVHPDSFVYSHFPAVSDFQLRSPEYKITTFYNGEDSLTDYMTKMPGSVINYQLDKLNGLGEFRKQTYLAEKAPFTNKLNNSVVANYYYNAFFEKLAYEYSEKENITSNNITALLELDSIARLTQSNINLGYNDVRTSYINQVERSLNWKMERFNVNNTLNGELRKMSSSKRIALRLRYRHYGKLRNIQFKYKSIDKNLDSYQKQIIRRPTIKRENAPDSAAYFKELEMQLYRLDSIKKLHNGLFSSSYNEESASTVNRIRAHSDSILFCRGVIRYYYINSFLYAHFVHQNRFFIDKVFLSNYIQSLSVFQQDSVWKLTQKQDSLLTQYYSNLFAYRAQLFKVIRFCQLNKKQSFDDFGEDKTIADLINSNKVFVNAHSNFVDSLIRYQRPIANALKGQNRVLVKSMSHIRFDGAVENRRHGVLRSHLNLERGRQKAGLKFMQNHLKTYHNAVKKGIAEYEKANR